MSLQFYLVPKVHAINEDHSWEFKIVVLNNTGNIFNNVNIKIDSNSHFSVQCSSFTVKRYDETHHKCKVVVSSHDIRYVIPELKHHLTFRLIDAETEAVHATSNYSVATDQFVRVLPKTLFHATAPTNILIFGIAGAGKSSFINGLHTLLSNSKMISNVVRVGGAFDHVTVRMEAVQLPQFANVRVIDTWGLTENNYSNELLRQFIKGYCEFGFSMHDKPPVHATSNSSERRIHSVIFFIPASMILGSNSDSFLQKTLQSFEYIRSKLKSDPILVVSQADKIDPSLRQNAANLNSNVSQLSDARYSIASKLGVNPASVYYCVNYTAEPYRSFAIDSNNFQILQAALYGALHLQDYLHYHPDPVTPVSQKPSPSNYFDNDVAQKSKSKANDNKQKSKNQNVASQQQQQQFKSSLQENFRHIVKNCANFEMQGAYDTAMQQAVREFVQQAAQDAQYANLCKALSKFDKNPSTDLAPTITNELRKFW